jgi:hypothetical protein
VGVPPGEACYATVPLMQHHAANPARACLQCELLGNILHLIVFFGWGVMPDCCVPLLHCMHDLRQHCGNGAANHRF